MLDVQERDVANLRARMPGVAAAAAVGATLLAPAATAGHHPAGFVEGAAFTVGLLGLAAVVAGLIGVLWSRPLVFAVSPRAVAAEAHESGLMSDATAFDIALAGVLEAMSAKNAVTLRKLTAASPWPWLEWRSKSRALAYALE